MKIKPRQPKVIRIRLASEMPKCDCCDEPWCPTHQEHYADCPCLGPHNAEENGYEVFEKNGELFARKV